MLRLQIVNTRRGYYYYNVSPEHGPPVACGRVAQAQMPSSDANPPKRRVWHRLNGREGRSVLDMHWSDEASTVYNTPLAVECPRTVRQGVRIGWSSCSEIMLISDSMFPAYQSHR